MFILKNINTFILSALVKAIIELMKPKDLIQHGTWTCKDKKYTMK